MGKKCTSFSGISLLMSKTELVIGSVAFNTNNILDRDIEITIYYR